MQKLNLPDFEIKLKNEKKAEVFCLIRKKWILLTPEEWVRQHFLNLLISHLSYPKGMIRLEHGLMYFKNAKRSDVTVLDRGGQMFMLIECKSSGVLLNQKAVNQLSEYNKVLNATYIVATNGMKHFIWKQREKEYVHQNNLPAYG